MTEDSETRFPRESEEGVCLDCVCEISRKRFKS